MCINPTWVYRKSGLRQEVACRKCWQCKANRQQDWIGRCIAERETCENASFVTLTYGTSRDYGEKVDDLGSKVLIYKDVQLWLKRMRANGYVFRYLLAGEYGARKGRSHWHVLLFWHGREYVPVLDADGIEWKPHYWPHGFCQWEDFTEKSAAYVLKYVTKEGVSESDQSMVRMSTSPPLGTEYLARQARKVAGAGLPLQDGFYWFPHVREYKSGKPRVFMIQGASIDKYCQAYVRAWQRLRGGSPPYSDYLEAFYDRNALPVPEWQPVGAELPKLGPDGERLSLSSWTISVNSTKYAVQADRAGVRLFWSYDIEGKRAWRSDIVTEATAERRREACARLRSSEAYLAASKGA